MLVKCGINWVDPNAVTGIEVEHFSFIGTNKPPLCPTGKEFRLAINQNENYFYEFFETEEEGRAAQDAYASIINSALVTQSFGGESDEEASAQA